MARPHRRGPPLQRRAATHAACLFATWEKPQAEEFYHKVKQNAVVVADDGNVAQQVVDGKLAFGLTDSSVAMAYIDHNMPVAIVYPDQRNDGMGTLLVPTGLAMLKDAPHADVARELIDFTVSAAVEESLSAGPTALLPLDRNSRDKVRLPGVKGIRQMKVDFAKAESVWDDAEKFLQQEFAENGEKNGPAAK